MEEIISAILGLFYSAMIFFFFFYGIVREEKRKQWEEIYGNTDFENPYDRKK